MPSERVPKKDVLRQTWMELSVSIGVETNGITTVFMLCIMLRLVSDPTVLFTDNHSSVNVLSVQ